MLITARLAGIAALIAFLLGVAAATFTDVRIFLPSLLQGAVVTIQVAFLSFALMIAAALIAGAARTSSIKLVRWSAGWYIEIFRGTSLLVQLFWFYFVMPEFGIALSAMAAGVLGVGLNFGAYGAEIVRGAIQSIPRGQLDASVALNMKPLHRIARVVMPQAMVIMVPPMGNLTIEMVKATSVVSAVTLVDITYASVQLNQLHYRTVEIFMITLGLYYCFSQLIRFSIGIIEARATRHLVAGH